MIKQRNEASEDESKTERGDAGRGWKRGRSVKIDHAGNEIKRIRR
jgi:hypothetical protein